MKCAIGIIWIVVILAGACSCTTPSAERTVFIRDTVIKILPPIIIDSGIATYRADTLIQIIETHNNDTITDIRYYPRENRFNWKIQPDTVTISKRDTLIFNKPIVNVIETPFMSKVGIGSTGAAIGILGLIAIYIFYLRKRA
jgi:hypothetical protein